jgi:phosphatidylinositol glycan class S
MLAYIPPRQQKPLLFKFPAAAAATDSEQQTKRKKKKGSLHTAALFVPRYGGVAVLNTLPDSCNSSSTVAGTDDDSGACELPASVAQEMMQVFVEQIRQTLGLSQDVAPPNLLCASSGGSSKGGSGACHPGSAPLLLPSPQSGVSSWELDLLAWRLVRLNMAESGALLRSLLLLLEQVPHMPVSAEIQHLVQQALTEQQRTMDLLRGGGGRDDGGAGAHADWRAAGLASQAAVSLAHQAFFHSQLLPALYFPDEHLYAVYLPLFLPITVPLLTGLAAWFAACSMQRKKQKAAAAAAAAAVAVAHASSS